VCLGFSYDCWGVTKLTRSEKAVRDSIASQMSVFLRRRHTAAAIAGLKVDLCSRELKLSTQVIRISVSAEARLVKEACAAAKARTVLLAEDTKLFIYLRTMHNFLWNQHLRNA